MILLLHAIVRVLFRLRLQVAPAVVQERPAVMYVARHRHRLDGLLLALCLPGRPRPVIDPEDCAGRLHAWLLRSLGALFLDLADPSSIRPLLRALSGPRPVLVFPTGPARATRTLLRIHDVPALAAVRAGIRVCPVDLAYVGQHLPRMRVHVSPAVDLRSLCLAGPGQRRVHAARAMRAVIESAVLAAPRPPGLVHGFLEAMRTHGARTQILEDGEGRRTSYGRLLRGSLAIGMWARHFSAEGQAVGVLLPNTGHTICTVLGLLTFGRVPAMLNYSSAPGSITAACVAARVGPVITSRAFLARARLDGLLPALAAHPVYYLEDLPPALGLAGRLRVLCACLVPGRIARRARPGQPGVILFTSGSEARPKGVVLSEDGILANVDQLALRMDFDERDKVLNALPLYHSYSFTAGMMLCLLTGTRLLLHLSPLHYRIIPQLAYRARCTYLFGTSTFLSYYGRCADVQDFRSLRFVISGGEKLGSDVARLWRDRFGLRIHEGYGATECSPVIAVSAPATYREGTVGPLLPGMEYRLRAVPGITTGGVLQLRGPNVMLGYLQCESPGVIQPPATDAGPGWYDTGDVVEVAADGNLSVVGRVRRFAKIAGEMISLDLLEAVAAEASPEHHHAAVVYADAERGETTLLYTTDPKLDRPRLGRAAQHLGYRDLAVARAVQWRPALPVLANGKTDYLSLAEWPVTRAAALPVEHRAAVLPAIGDPV